MANQQLDDLNSEVLEQLRVADDVTLINMLNAVTGLESLGSILSTRAAFHNADFTTDDLFGLGNSIMVLAQRIILEIKRFERVLPCCETQSCCCCRRHH